MRRRSGVFTSVKPEAQKTTVPLRIRSGTFWLFAAVVFLGALGFALAALGGELGGGEGDAAEKFAGVFGAARGVAAFLGGDAVVHNGDDQLGVPLQADDGKLAQGHIEFSPVGLEHQVLVKLVFHPLRQLHRAALPGKAVADFPHPGAEDHGVQGFYDGCGAVGKAVGPAVAAVDVGPAFLAAEHHPLGKDGQTAQGRRAAGADDRIRQHPVEEGDVDAVVAAVKGHGADVYVGAQQLRTPDSRPGGALQGPLGAGGEIDGQVLNAVLVPTGVGDFTGVNGHCLPQVVGAAAQGVCTLIGHGITS